MKSSQEIIGGRRGWEKKDEESTDRFPFLFFSLFKVLTFDKQKNISENENGGDYEYILF